MHEGEFGTIYHLDKKKKIKGGNHPPQPPQQQITGTECL